MNTFNVFSNTQLHALFSNETWNNLSFDDKVNVCQEVENRWAKENGVAPCIVQTKYMQGGTYGYQSGNTITLNESLLKNGTFITSYTDPNGNIQIREIPVLAPNWNTLDTIYHEGTHGIQEATGRMPYTYITSEADSSLYRIQGIEKEAFAVGQLKTLEAISDVEQYTGIQDPTQKDYIEYIKIDSFNSALDTSISNYNDPNIEQTLNDVIQDRDQGIQRKYGSPSYQAINNLCDNQYFLSRESLHADNVQSSSIDGSASFYDDATVTSTPIASMDGSLSFYDDTTAVIQPSMDGSSSFYGNESAQGTESSQTNENSNINDYGV